MSTTTISPITIESLAAELTMETPRVGRELASELAAIMLASDDDDRRAKRAYTAAYRYRSMGASEADAIAWHALVATIAWLAAWADEVAE